MARIFNNIFVRGLTGNVGDQFIIRQNRNGETIIANKPRFRPDREFTEQQKAQQDAFREATTYAKFAKNQPIYQEQAKLKRTSAYNIAVADWFGEPEVLEIDTTGWTGQAGQTIRIKAQDNVWVASVHVTIGNPVLEHGEAVREEGLWWSYTTTTSAPAGALPGITAVAKDLPGNGFSLFKASN